MHTPCPLGKDLAARSLRERYDALNALIEAAGRGEREGVHEARIASRKLRVALAEFAAEAPKRSLKPARGRVRDITRLLGRPRELDVMIALLEADDIELSDDLKRGRIAAIKALRKHRARVGDACALAAAYTQDIAFAAAMRQVMDTLPEDSRCIRKRAARGLTDSLKELRGACKSWLCESGETALHRVRIRFKKFRYTCELYAPLYGCGMDEHISRLKSIQDVLGDWNDWRVLRDELRELARNATKLQKPRFNALAELCAQRADAFLAVFEEAAAPILNKHDRKEFRAFLENPAIKCCREA